MTRFRATRPNRIPVGRARLRRCTALFSDSPSSLPCQRLPGTRIVRPPLDRWRSSGVSRVAGAGDDWPAISLGEFNRIDRVHDTHPRTRQVFSFAPWNRHLVEKELAMPRTPSRTRFVQPRTVQAIRRQRAHLAVRHILAEPVRRRARRSSPTQLLDRWRSSRGDERMVRPAGHDGR